MIPRNGHEWGSLGAFTGGAKTTESIMVGREILLVVALELLDEVADEPVAKVLATKVRVTGGGLDLEDILFNSKQGNIEHSMPLSICHCQPNAFPVQILEKNTLKDDEPSDNITSGAWWFVKGILEV